MSLGLDPLTHSTLHVYDEFHHMRTITGHLELFPYDVTAVDRGNLGRASVISNIFASSANSAGTTNYSSRVTHVGG
jgi:hypothetical protein